MPGLKTKLKPYMYYVHAVNKTNDPVSMDKEGRPRCYAKLPTAQDAFQHTVKHGKEVNLRQQLWRQYYASVVVILQVVTKVPISLHLSHHLTHLHVLTQLRLEAL